MEVLGRQQIFPCHPVHVEFTVLEFFSNIHYNNSKIVACYYVVSSWSVWKDFVKFGLIDIVSFCSTIGLNSSLTVTATLAIQRSPAASDLLHAITVMFLFNLDKLCSIRKF